MLVRCDTLMMAILDGLLLPVVLHLMVVMVVMIVLLLSFCNSFKDDFFLHFNLFRSIG